MAADQRRQAQQRDNAISGDRNKLNPVWRTKGSTGRYGFPVDYLCFAAVIPRPALVFLRKRALAFLFGLSEGGSQTKAPPATEVTDGALR